MLPGTEKLELVLMFFIFFYKPLKVPLFFDQTVAQLDKSKKAKYTIKARYLKNSK